jgi:hypothetical protein
VTSTAAPEEGTPEEREADRLRAGKATPEMKLEAWRLYQETNAELQRALGNGLSEARYEERLHPRGRADGRIINGATTP